MLKIFRVYVGLVALLCAGSGQCLPAIDILRSPEEIGLTGVRYWDTRKTSVVDASVLKLIQDRKSLADTCSNGSNSGLCYILRPGYEYSSQDIQATKKADPLVIYEVTAEKPNCGLALNNLGGIMMETPAAAEYQSMLNSLTILMRSIAITHEIPLSAAVIICNGEIFFGKTGGDVLAGYKARIQHLAGGSSYSLATARMPRQPASAPRFTGRGQPTMVESSLDSLDIGTIVHSWARSFFPRSAAVTLLQADQYSAQVLVVGVKGIVSNSVLLPPWEKLYIAVHRVANKERLQLTVHLDGHVAFGLGGPPAADQYTKDIYVYYRERAEIVRHELAQQVLQFVLKELK